MENRAERQETRKRAETVFVSGWLNAPSAEELPNIAVPGVVEIAQTVRPHLALTGEAARTRTELGSHVICEDKELLYEEAPQAYKNIAIVIDDLVKAGLANVLAVLKPLVTYKVRR